MRTVGLVGKVGPKFGGATVESVISGTVSPNYGDNYAAHLTWAFDSMSQHLVQDLQDIFKEDGINCNCDETKVLKALTGYYKAFI